MRRFWRREIQQEEYAELFEEKLLEGKQSNLNADLKAYVNSYPYVLYAFDGSDISVIPYAEQRT